MIESEWVNKRERASERKIENEWKWKFSSQWYIEGNSERESEKHMHIPCVSIKST
jgi:hypothetical protein